MSLPAGQRKTIVIACALALASAVLANASGAAPGADESRQKPRQQQPNVIVIMTDDQNDSLQAMPAVRKLLAGRGTTFTRAFVSMPLCCPSRATFLTGQYAHNHRVLSNDPLGRGGLQALQHQRDTLPVWLRRAGYRTAHVGKYLNGYGRYHPGLIPPGWQRWFTLVENRHGQPLPGGEQFRYGYTVNADGRVSTWPRRGRYYLTDVLRRKALKLVDGWAPSSRPFFLWFTPNNPHGETAPAGYVRNPRPAPRHMGIYESESMPIKPSFNEADVSDKPSQVRDEPLLDPETIADLELRYRSRLESLLSVDEAIAALIRHLRRTHELRRTLIVFTSDNGILLGEHRLRFKGFDNKQALYEEAIAVPLIARGPGFPAGARRAALASNVDLAATILRASGAKPTRALDGVPLQSLARRPRRAYDRSLLLESTDGTYGLRTRRFLYAHHASDELELYDLRHDPFELESLAGAPGYAAALARLERRAARLHRCAGPSCRRLDGSGP
jgi:N-acetylglucosamine-6-sulfatase